MDPRGKSLHDHFCAHALYGSELHVSPAQVPAHVTTQRFGYAWEMRNDPDISWYPIAERDELPEDVAKLFAKAEAALGFVPNVFQAMTFRVEHFRSWFSHFKQLHVPSPNLSAADREMIAVVVSMTNGCLYCLVAHGAALREALGDPVLADRITLDWKRADLNAKQKAICAYAEKLTKHPTDTTQEDITHLQSFGLTPEETWDIAEITAMYNFTNRLAMATGQLPNREYHGLHR
jgi:uncharacterized peroxidase-related enzyme